MKTVLMDFGEALTLQPLTETVNSVSPVVFPFASKLAMLAVGNNTTALLAFPLMATEQV